MIDLTKTYTTRCGYPVQLYTTGGPNLEYPVFGTYRDAGGYWFPDNWASDGLYREALSDLDLVEAKPPLPTITVYRTEEKKPPAYRTVFILQSTGFRDHEGRWFSHREGVIPPTPWWASYAE